MLYLRDEPNKFITFISRPDCTRLRVDLNFHAETQSLDIFTQTYVSEEVALKCFLNIVEDHKHYFAYDSEVRLAKALLEAYNDLHKDPDKYIEKYLLKEHSQDEQATIRDHVCKVWKYQQEGITQRALTNS